MHKNPSKGERNRLRIVQAADDLFYHQGYNITSFTDIAESAAVPRGNFYYYFKSKDEILKSVVDRRVDWLKAQLREWEQGAPDARTQLLAFTQMMLDNVDNILRWGCPLGTLNVELGKTQHELQEEAVRLFDVLIEWMIPRFEALGHGERSRESAMHLLGCSQGVILMANTYRDRSFLEAEVVRLRRWIEEQ